MKIWAKITDKLDPPKDESGNLVDPDDKPMNPFDMDEGANFKLKIRKVEGYSNSDKSEFEKPSKVANQDAVKENLFLLSPLVDPKLFKSFDVLETKLNQVLGVTAQPSHKPKPEPKDDDEEFEDVPDEPKKSKPAKAESTDGDDSDLDYFRRLASE